VGGCRVDPVGSGLGPVAGSCKYGDEPAGSGTTELASLLFKLALYRYRPL
jgi:hypothetical protein